MLNCIYNRKWSAAAGLTVFILLASVNCIYSRTITEYYNSLNKISGAASWSEGAELAVDATNTYPEEIGFHTYLNYCLRMLKKNKEALQQIEMIVKEHPDSKDLSDNYRESLMALGWEKTGRNRKNEALPLFQKAYEMATNGEWELNAYGYILRELSNYSLSAEVLEHGYSLYPTNWYISGNLFYSYLNNANLERDNSNFITAEELYQKAGKIIPDQEWLLLNYGYLLRLRGDFEGSLKMLSRGRELYKTNSYYKRDILYTYLEYERRAAADGDTNRALSIGLKALKSYPGYPWLLTDISGYYDSLGKFLEAAEILVRSVLSKEAPAEEKKFGFNFKNNLFNISAGMLFKLAENKDFEQAGKLVRLIEKHFPGSYITLSLEGNLLFLKGKVKEGIKKANAAYSAYLKEYPETKKKVIVIDPPLRGMVLTGGNNSETAITHAGLNRFCYDFTGCAADGGIMIKPGLELGDNDNMIGFGREIICPVEGTVEKVVDGFADKPPQNNYSLGDGNYIIVSGAEGYKYLFMHNKQRSARVSTGQKVKKGDVLAEMGNTGMTSVPHLHFGVYTKEWVLSLPVKFKNYYRIKKNGKKELIKTGVPQSGDIIERVR